MYAHHHPHFYDDRSDAEIISFTSYIYKCADVCADVCIHRGLSFSIDIKTRLSTQVSSNFTYLC